MKNNTKKVFKLISITEYKSLEKYLEKMAAKGFMLSEIKRNTFVFKKTEPRELSFNVSLFYHTTPFDYPDGEKDRDYRALCEESGWIFCTKNNFYQIFYKEKGIETIPIHTDNNEEYRIIKNAFLKTDFILLPCVLLFIIMGIVNIRNFDYEDLLSNSALFSLIWPIMITLLFSITLIPSLDWLIRNKINLRNGKGLTFHTEKQIRLKNSLFWSVIGLYSIFFLFSMVDLIGMTSKAKLYMLIMMPILLPTIITLICLKRFKTKKRTRKQNIIFFSLAIGLTTIISLTSVMMMIVSTIPNQRSFDKNDDLPAEVPVLELADFGTVDKPGRTRIYKKSSMFSPTNIEYYESLGRKAEDNEVSTVRTTYIECLNEGIANYIYESYMSKEREFFIRYLEDTGKQELNEEDYITKTPSEIWNVDKGYLIENRTQVVLLKGRVIYILKCDVDFTDNHIIDICKEKLAL